MAAVAGKQNKTASYQSASLAGYRRPGKGGAAFPSSEAVTVTVDELSYSVAAKEWLPGCQSKLSLGKCRKASSKVLLDRVNLMVKPGELLAILGPSGSGKTTLLNVLAMRSPSSRITGGAVLYNGQAETKHSVRKKVNYVMAHDKLLPYLTVLETFIFAAQLKLPVASPAERMERIERILDDMQLQHCRHTYIGGDWRRGISTGELKRVTIGIELLDDPPLLILDEPTSGLDSVLGVRIVELLRSEANRGKTVVATVHQPSTQVFNMFHSVALLSQGRVVYSGPTSDVMEYFQRLGLAPKGDWNPSDFLLELVSTPRPTVVGGAPVLPLVDEAASPGALAQAWSESKEAGRVVAEIASATEPRITPSASDGGGAAPVSSRGWSLWLNEVTALWRRTILNTIRNPLSWLVVLLIQVMQALIIGGIMFQRTQVTNGPPPDPLGSDSFWTHSWIRAFNLGTDLKGNRPVLSAFEQGVDGRGSFVVTSPTENDQWLERLHFLVDKSLTCLHQTYRLEEMGYPNIPDIQNPPSTSHVTWEPRRIYSNIMAGYQFLDLISSTRSTWGINFGYFDYCNATHPESINVDLCVRFYSRAFNPMLECFQLWPLPDNPPPGTDVPMWSHERETIRPELQRWHRPSTPEWEVKADTFATNRNRIWNELIDPYLKLPSTTEAGPIGPSGADVEPVKPAAPVKNIDSSIVGSGGVVRDETDRNPHEDRLDEILDQLPVMIRDLIDQNLKRFLVGVVEWVTRSTECEDPICEGLLKLRKSIETMSSATADTVLGLLNLAGCLFFVATILGFASYDSLLTFPQERALFNREAANGLYRSSSYFIAKNFADAPFQLLPCCIMGTILYFMIGFEASLGAFVVYVVLCVLTSFCAYGFGYMVSAASPRMEVAILVAPLTLTIWLVLAGFFLRDGDIPLWIDWFKYLSFYRWAFFGLVANQFPSSGYFGTIPNVVAQAIVGVTLGNTGICIALLIILGLAYRVAGFVFLKYTNRTVGLEA